MSLSHMIILAIIILVVVPPEKLPEVMRTIGSLFNDIRRQTSGIWDDLKNEAAFNPNEILKPADFTIKNILDEKKSSTAEDVKIAENVTEKKDADPKQS